MKYEKILRIGVAILLGVIVMFRILDNISFSFNGKSDSKSDSDSWYTPMGKAKTLNFYSSSDNSFISTEDTLNEKLIGSYQCYSDSCKVYSGSVDTNEVIIYDQDYIIYDCMQEQAKKLRLNEFSSINFLVYNYKSYFLQVFNEYGFFAIYSLEKNEFVTDFKYTTLVSENSVSLKYNNLIVKRDDKNILVNLKNGEELFETTNDLNAIENDKYIYYYEKKEDGYIIYNSDMKMLFELKKDAIFSVSKSGNLVIKNDDETFSMYNNKGVLIKNSKKYDKVCFLVKDYAVVIDDNYLKIVNYDGNVLVKYDNMSNYSLNYDTSGWKKIDDKEGIYLVITNDKNEEKEYHYVPKS